MPNGHTYLCRRKAAKARFDNRQPGRSKYPYRGWASGRVSHGRRFSLLPLHPQAFPLDGSAVLNDTPVACQIREPTDPQGDRCPHIPAALAATYPLRCFAPQWARFDNRHSTSAPTPILTAVSGSGASVVFVSDGDNFAPRRELLLSAVTKVAKSTA